MFGQRLKEERARLGLTQPQLAEKIGSAKRTVIDWEQEKSSPTAKQLMTMNEIGIDTSYLLTGVESQDLKDKANVYSSTLAEDELIKTRIQLMLNQADFRSALREMNDEQVKAMVQLVKSFAKGN